MSGTLVPARGPRPCPVLLVGEAPGAQEAVRGEPFVGRAGAEQDWYLGRHSLSSRLWRRANVVPEYTEGNPDPTPEQIERFTPDLYAELDATQPRIILAVGRFAMRWFLGERANLRACHGIPHRAGAFDPSRADRGGPHDAIIIPIQHPASGFYSGDARASIAWDYAQAADAIRRLERGERVEPRTDEHEGAEDYLDLSGHDLATFLSFECAPILAIDTEGSPDAPWSIQVSTAPGRAYVLRRSQPDFDEGIATLRREIEHGALVVLHNAMWDLAVCRALGLELRRAQLFDTTYAAYLLRTEPQGLKALAWRWCGMRMDAYDSIIRAAAATRQFDYLARVLDHGAPPTPPEKPVAPPPLPKRGVTKEQRAAQRAARAAYKEDLEDWRAETNDPVYRYGAWGRPAARVETSNDGSDRLYQPQDLNARVIAILRAYGEAATGDEELGDDADDGEGEGLASTVDLAARWLDIPPDVRAPAEALFGPFPAATLDDAPLDTAVRYAARDADATLRLYHALQPALTRLDLYRTMADCMAVLPVFEEMRATGMTASRERFTALAAELNADMEAIQWRLSTEFFDRRPFNPASSPHVATLLRRRGLTGEKTTSTGKVSTAKKSIEHLRHTDPAIALVMDWRERQKIRDTFCRPALERAAGVVAEGGGDADLFPMRCRLKTTRVATRRLAAADPNLLQIPARNELSLRVRDCYVAPPGELYGAWDLSQIEVRVLAHFSEDPLLCKFLNKGADIHTETAARMFKIPVDAVDKMKHRYPAKRLTFGISYGLSGAGLYDQLRMLSDTGAADWDIPTCERLIEEWYNIYSGVRDYKRRVANDARKTGYVRDHWGMYRFIPGIWSYDRRVAAEAERIAVSHLIQGGAQGLIQRSIAWLRDRIWELQDAGANVHWVLQVHDELVLRFDADLAPLLHDLVIEGLTLHGGLELRVPVEAEGKCAESWGALK